MSLPHELVRAGSAAHAELATPSMVRFSAIPSRAAVRFGDQDLTYAELDAQSDRLAERLLRLGVTPDDRVAVAVERSLRLPVVVLAVFKTGAAYVPIDTRLPPARVAFLLRDCDPRVLLTEKSVGLSTTATTLFLDDEPDDAEADESWSADVDHEGPAYVIYTSGSTGEPKGVEMGRRALANLIDWQCADSAAAEDWRTLQYSPLSFDIHFQELFSTWATGGTVVMVDEATRTDSEKLLDFLDAEGIHRLFLPPLALENLAEIASLRRRFPPSLREVIVAGESLRIVPSVRKFFTHLPGCALVNQYGTTETHVVSRYRMPVDPSTWPMLPPVGEPLPGLELCIVDDENRGTLGSDPGELLIGGVGLADRYYRRPDLTAERFRDHGGRRFYRTGDRVRLRDDGQHEFLGRLDNQVKIRGQRVELGEVEAVLSKHAAVAQCAVVLHGDRQRGNRLVAYWTPSRADGATAAELRRFLRETLPDYMVPSAFLRLESFPRTPSGKLDRKSLPKPTGSRSSWDGEYRAPRTAFESQLAALWEELLEAESIGISDNFFELGGDSLLAVKLVVMLHERFGCTLTLADLVRGPTIEQMTKFLGNRAASSSAASMVCLQPLGGPRPLFCVPGVGPREAAIFGSPSCFANLAEWLAPRQQMYAFCLHYETDQKGAEPVTVERIAADLLRDVREKQPAGPYRLAGFSFGGMIVFEMARQLRAAGEDIESLTLIDTIGPGYPRRRPWRLRPGYHRAMLRRLPIARWPAYLLTGIRRSAISSGLFVRRSLGKLLGRKDPWSGIAKVERAYLTSHPTLDGSMALFVASATAAETEDQAAFDSDESLGSRAVSGRLALHRMHADHATILQEPVVSEIADAMMSGPLATWTAEV